ncbi:hypothetical protein [Marinomonas ostreistagni]|uniref:Uncharacterized protein n=1 Tax=Marinomonas ostreistagni TaxID=359209 RepID=A0ABS0Z9B6_9GAMM|nr:hypothetical protein [Marinomonas ostreistagni]MBJ7550241.1 hypothetical protein [Marinomonas ostreistagni]
MYISSEEQVKPFIESVEESKRVLEELLEEMEKPKRALEAIDLWYKELPSQTREAVEFLVNKGWFCDDLEHFDLEVLNEGSTLEWEVIEHEIEEYFDDHLDRIEGNIISRLKNPERAKIIASVFEAHRNGLYNLTVPTTSAQVDGICIDATADKHFFMMSDKKPQVSPHVYNLTKGYLTDALIDGVFKVKIPVNQSSWDRDENFSGLNRHQVLHGEVCDYGTKINSLKAISLLNFVSIALAGGFKYP